MSQPLAAAAVAPFDLRRAASLFATGVALVTAPGGLALVVDSFISASLEPPLVGFAPSRVSLTWRSMRRTGRFGVSVLGAAHAGGIRERARPGADRLAGLDVELLDGIPVVRDALAAFVCALEAEHPAGDHSIVVGRVLAIRHGDDRPPLVAFAPSRTSLTWRRMRRTGRFGVSVLDAAHAGGIRERARLGADRLAGLDLELLDGVPVVRHALAALVCVVEAEHPAGDHSIVLGRVLAIRHGDDRPPLVFFSGGFSTIQPTRTGGPS